MDKRLGLALAERNMIFFGEITALGTDIPFAKCMHSQGGDVVLCHLRPDNSLAVTRTRLAQDRDGIISDVSDLSVVPLNNGWLELTFTAHKHGGEVQKLVLSVF